MKSRSGTLRMQFVAKPMMVTHHWHYFILYSIRPNYSFSVQNRLLYRIIFLFYANLSMEGIVKHLISDVARSELAE